MFIAVRIDGMPIREYASSIGVDENNITQKLKRATKKLQQEYKNRRIDLPWLLGRRSRPPNNYKEVILMELQIYKPRV